MTLKFNNAFLKNVSAVGGPYEKKGKLKSLLDKTYDDFYLNEDSLEKAEVKLMEDSLQILLNKSKLKSDNIDLFIAGDLENQITASSYAVEKFKKPFLGIFSACATYPEGLIIAASMLENKSCNNVIVSVSSHNMVSEKQFRNPTEYGSPKPTTATFTVTGASSALVTKKDGEIKIESGTIGKVLDMNQTDPYNMGAVMAGAAADTIKQHLDDLNRDINYYDLILTGDLGEVGKKILIDYMKEKYKIDISEKYDDCGLLVFSDESKKDVKSGGSGPSCSGLVINTVIYNKLLTHELKKVLYVGTGALFNPTFVFQKQNIMSIAHAVSLEAVK